METLESDLMVDLGKVEGIYTFVAVSFAFGLDNKMSSIYPILKDLEERPNLRRLKVQVVVTEMSAERFAATDRFSLLDPMVANTCMFGVVYCPRSGNLFAFALRF